MLLGHIQGRDAERLKSTAPVCLAALFVEYCALHFKLICFSKHSCHSEIELEMKVRILSRSSWDTDGEAIHH